jgi:hypothetical protein
VKDFGRGLLEIKKSYLDVARLIYNYWNPCPILC